MITLRAVTVPCRMLQKGEAADRQEAAGLPEDPNRTVGCMIRIAERKKRQA